MQLSEALNLFDRILLENRGKRLKPLEREILIRGWENSSYRDIPGYQEQTIKNNAARLWKYLSKLLHTKINKQNVREVLEDLDLSWILPASAKQIVAEREFYGRVTELCQLQSRILRASDAVQDSSESKLVLLSGMSGIGKTTLAQKLAVNVAAKFDRVVWISLAEAPPLLDTLAIIGQELGKQGKTKSRQDLGMAIDETIGYLQSQRCLLVLDNAEKVWCVNSGADRDLVQEYTQFLDILNWLEHQSCCLMIADRNSVALQSSYQQMELAGLDLISCQQLLGRSDLVGDPTDWNTLIDKYHGNPQYLQIVAPTIKHVFNGKIRNFLAANVLIYDRIETFLPQQLERLSNIEMAVLAWLTILWQQGYVSDRQPVTIDRLRTNLTRTISDRDLMKTWDKSIDQYLVEAIDTVLS